jgi:hypothetical protein
MSTKQDLIEFENRLIIKLSAILGTIAILAIVGVVVLSKLF